MSPRSTRVVPFSLHAVALLALVASCTSAPPVSPTAAPAPKPPTVSATTAASPAPVTASPSANPSVSPAASPSVGAAATKPAASGTASSQAIADRYELAKREGKVNVYGTGGTQLEPVKKAFEA